MKAILITGSNKGIGYESARQLLELGHHVVISGRDKIRVEQAASELRKPGGSVESLVMDVSDPSSIAKAAASFGLQKRKLDVLINNAALLDKADKDLLRDPEQMLLESLNANSVGPLRVVRAFLPYLSSPGRIINVSSGGGSMTDPVEGWSPAYCVSKSLLNAITRHLANELDDMRVSVNAVCPGWVKTDMGGRSAPRSVERGAETIVWMATNKSITTGKFFRDRREIPW